MSEIHEQQIQGIKQALQDLRRQESQLIKAQGLDEQLEKSRQHVKQLENDIETSKADVAEVET